MVAIVIEPSFERRLSRIKEVERQEVISHQGDWALGSYSALRRSSVGVLFRINPKWSRSRELVTCHNITITSPPERELRRACSCWYDVLEVVETEEEKQLHWKVSGGAGWAAGDLKNPLTKEKKNQPSMSMKNLLTQWETEEENRQIVWWKTSLPSGNWGGKPNER